MQVGDKEGGRGDAAPLGRGGGDRGAGEGWPRCSRGRAHPEGRAAPGDVPRRARGDAAVQRGGAGPGPGRVRGLYLSGGVKVMAPSSNTAGHVAALCVGWVGPYVVLGGEGGEEEG